jgi:hypothetical protein
VIVHRLWLERNCVRHHFPFLSSAALLSVFRSFNFCHLAA